MSDLVTKACKLAMQYHAGQMYGKYAYHHHLEEVAKYVKEIHRKGLFGSVALDKDVLIAVAYLHDILEDTDISWSLLLNEVGEDVFDAVASLTKMIEAETYEQYINSVKRNAYAHIVKIADTWANLDNSWKAGHTGRIKKYTNQLNLLLEGL